MRILPILVLLSALAIAGCAAYFSIVGLQLLFVGGGISIVIMGIGLEVGKLITATFLKQKWHEIGWMLRSYMMLATLVLVLITSIGIYGYLSAGYNATANAVQGYERVIETNNARIAEIERDNVFLKEDKFNERESSAIEANRKTFITQRLELVAQKNSQIEKIRAGANADNGFTTDLAAAKQALEISKQATDADIAREQEQIKLYNSRLEILDREVQKWLDEGRGSVFRKGGLDKARETKESQKNERDDIDAQIRSSQDRIEKLRIQYTDAIERYNSRVASIDARADAQRVEAGKNIEAIQKEIAEIMASVDAYNRDTDATLAQLSNAKATSVEINKKKIEANLETVARLHVENDEMREKIIRTDVGTFKFISNSLGIELNKAVNYFIWTIMFVFDPLAVCLILAYNSMTRSESKKNELGPPKESKITKKQKVEAIVHQTPEESIQKPTASGLTVDKIGNLNTSLIDN